MKILVSHGSGGVGSAELYTKKFFEDRGIEVIINDYFTPHGIKNLRWHENNPDNYNVTFKEMFDIDVPQDEKLVHIGFSLGGFFGICHVDKFFKNYLFYPGVIGYTESMLKKDYSNTVAIVGTSDTGSYKFENFKSKLEKPPITTYYLNGAHHAFMVDNISRSFDMVRYDLLEPIDDKDFDHLMPNHAYMSSKYGYYNSTQVLESHTDYRWNYLNIIYEDLNEYNSKI